MTECNDYIPRSCAQAFSRLEIKLARMEKLGESTHERVSAMQLRMDELGEQSARRREDMSQLRGELESLQNTQARSDRNMDVILSAGWRVAVILASIVAAVTGLKNILK